MDLGFSHSRSWQNCDGEQDGMIFMMMMINRKMMNNVSGSHPTRPRQDRGGGHDQAHRPQRSLAPLESQVIRYRFIMHTCIFVFGEESKNFQSDNVFFLEYI